MVRSGRLLLLGVNRQFIGVTDHRWSLCLQHVFAQSRSATLPVQTLKVSEDQLVALEVVDNAIDTSVAGDVVHVLVLLDSCSAVTVFVGLSFEDGDAEATGLEDVDNLHDDVVSLTPGLASRDVGLEGCVGALGLGGDVDGEVVG